MTTNETPNPAGILCGNGHRHASINSVRACHLGREGVALPAWADAMLGAPSAPSPRTPVAPVAPRPSAPPTPAPPSLLDAIRRHGVTPRDGITAREARDTLNRLIEGKERREASMRAAQPTEVDTSTIHKTELGISAEMLFDIREGRYAIPTRGTTRLDFVRLSVVKPSKAGKFVRYQGCLKVQTQHGESYKTRAYIARNGEVALTSNTMDATYLTAIFMAIIVDQKAAAHRYGREKGMCCRCGKELTDERSRYYGIGPECEKKWETFVPEMDERHGAFAGTTDWNE